MFNTVTDYLNVRLDSPDTGAASISYLSPGETVEVLEVVKGTEIEGNDVWLRLKDRTFIWSGATNLPDSFRFAEMAAVATAANDLARRIVLNNPVQASGAGIVIALCDGGIDVRHPSLQASMMEEQDCLTIPHGPSLQNNHGCRVAGLLTGNDDHISGMAVNAKIRSFRVLGDNNETDEIGLRNALKSIVDSSNQVDVVNLSLDFSASTAPIQNFVNSLVARGIVVTVAGNEGAIGNINQIAGLQQVISVGTFEVAEFAAVKAAWYPGNIHFAFFNKAIDSMGLFSAGNGHAPIGRSSAYTGVLSGIIARFLSQKFISPQQRQKAVRDYLQSCAFAISKDSQPVPFKLYQHA